MFSQAAVHRLRKAQPVPAPIRGGVRPDAGTRHASTDETSKINGRASVLHDQIPHLRTPSTPAARKKRGPHRNRSRGYGIQPEAHDEGTWSSQADSSSSEKLKSRTLLRDLNEILTLLGQQKSLLTASSVTASERPPCQGRRKSRPVWRSKSRPLLA